MMVITSMFPMVTNLKATMFSSMCRPYRRRQTKLLSFKPKRCQIIEGPLSKTKPGDKFPTDLEGEISHGMVRNSLFFFKGEKHKNI